MKFSRLLVSMALPVVMAGCASFPGTTYQLEELERTTPVGSCLHPGFDPGISGLRRFERAQYSWFNSQHFARKGLAAAQGTVVAPEDPANWSISDKPALAELTAQRARLLTDLAGNAPARVPRPVRPPPRSNMTAGSSNWTRAGRPTKSSPVARISLRRRRRHRSPGPAGRRRRDGAACRHGAHRRRTVPLWIGESRQLSAVLRFQSGYLDAGGRP